MTRSTASARDVRSRDVRSPLPYLELFAKPTPLDRLVRFGAALGSIAADVGHDPNVEVWMKREDLMAIGLGGNKLRNIEFHVGLALARGADTLVTSGRGSANHCRLIAAAAARADLRSVLVLSGPEPVSPGPNERLSRLFGAELRYAADATSQARDALQATIVAELRTLGRLPYEIEIGASGVVGASGQVLAGIEVARQLADRRIAPDYLFVGAATGGTCAGLSVGLRLAGLSTTVIAVPTHLSTASSPAALAEHIVALTAQLRELWGDRGVGAPGRTDWDEVPAFDDLSDWRPFGTPSTAATAAARLLARTEGIAADPVYTARVAAAIVAWAAAGRLSRKRVVFWNGGGTPALFEESGEPGSIEQFVRRDGNPADLGVPR